MKAKVVICVHVLSLSFLSHKDCFSSFGARYVRQRDDFFDMCGKTRETPFVWNLTYHPISKDHNPRYENASQFSSIHFLHFHGRAIVSILSCQQTFSSYSDQFGSVSP